MFQMKDTFRSYDENRQPYTFHVERLTETANLHAGVTDRGFSLKSVGNRHILNAPAVVSFRWDMAFSINYMEVQDPVFTLFFQYDERLREGLGVRLRYHLAGQLDIELVSVEKSLFQVLGAQSFAVRWQENAEETLSLRGDSAGVTCAVSGVSAAFARAARPGRLAIERNNFIGELMISRMAFETDDGLPARTLLPSVTADIPLINGGDIPYVVTWRVDSVGDETYLFASLSGGTKTRKVNREDRLGQYVAEKDFMTSPYVGVRDRDCDRIFQLSLGENSFIDPNIFWDCQKGFFNDTPIPIEGVFRLTDFAPDGAELIFGYEKLNCTGYGAQAGGCEFRFRPDGTLVYQGAPLDGRESWEIYSPFDKAALSLIPAGAWHREALEHHIKYNHYFERQEAIAFRLERRTALDPRYLSICADVMDVFERRVLAEAEVQLTAEPARGGALLKAAAAFPPMEVGVYRIRFRLFYGDRLYDTMTRAFEVFDRDTDENPARKCGLPYTFSMPNEQKWLMSNSFDLWSPAVSCDVEHFITCITDTPIEAETRRPWEIVGRFKREWFAWLGRRTANDWRSDRHAVVRQNADYLLYTMDDQIDDWLGACSLFPLRPDHWDYSRVNNPYQRALLKRFLEEHPGAAEEIGYAPSEETISYDAFEALMNRYGRAWIDFVNADVLRLLREQNEELRRENPRVRRSAYGPITTYTAPTLSHRTARFYGMPEDGALTEDVYSGFAVYEDYPYSCGYQTYRGAFGVMTLQLQYPGLRIYPEQYRGSAGGCIDGAVKFAHAPMGAYELEAYQNSTHAFEFVFNTAHRSADGYHYWSDWGFHRTNYESGFMNQLIRDWYYAVQYAPKKPLRALGFVTDYGEDDDVFTHIQLEDSQRVYAMYNRCESASGLLHECSRESGVPNGFALKAETLSTLRADECDLLVLPSVKGLGAGAVREIRRLYEAGVNLIGLFDVTGLEDLFGVRPSPAAADVRTVEYGGGEEAVYSRRAEFAYAADGARAVMTANGTLPALLATERTLLINTDVENLGCEEPRRVNVSSGYHIVGGRLRAALRDEVARLSRPLARGENVGVTLFESQSGKTVLLAIDYSPFDNVPRAEKEAVVRLGLPSVTRAASDTELFVGRDNGVVRELRFPIQPHGFVFVELEREVSDGFATCRGGGRAS